MLTWLEQGLLYITSTELSKTHEQILRDQRDKSLRMYTTLRNSKLLVAAMCYNNKCKQADGAVPS